MLFKPTNFQCIFCVRNHQNTEYIVYQRLRQFILTNDLIYVGRICETITKLKRIVFVTASCPNNFDLSMNRTESQVSYLHRKKILHLLIHTINHSG